MHPESAAGPRHRLGDDGPRVDRLPGTIAPRDSLTVGAAQAADFRDYLISELRCAALRARLAATDIDTIGIALRAGMIDCDTAIEWLMDVDDALKYVAPSPPIAAEAAS